jgi:serine protease Do
MMRKGIFIGLLIFTTVSPLFAGDISTRVFGLPISEVKAILTEWIEQTGKRVTVRHAAHASIGLAVQGVTQQHLIVLRSRSAIATEVEIRAVAGHQGKDSFIPEIYAFLDGYSHAIGITHQRLRNLPEDVIVRKNAVVCIGARSGPQDVQFSGFFVDKDGLILSTTHDLESLEGIQIGTHDGRLFGGRLLKFDRQKDLALISVPTPSPNYVSIDAGRERPVLGETVYSVGCPINLIGTVFAGTINGPSRLIDGLPLLQVDLRIHPGSSGSPAFDEQGRLVGIVRARYRGTESIGFLIPFETIVSFLREP